MSNEAMDTEMGVFWDSVHTHTVMRSLSGNSENTLDILRVREQFALTHDMLNIGVGIGAFEKYCAGEGKVIDSLDIAPLAGERVKDVGRNFYLAPSDIPSDSYDLSTELLVAQHTLDATLESHIEHAIRGLRPTGLYALQSPTFINPLPHKQTQTVKAMQRGTVCRSIGWIEEVVRKHGAYLSAVHYYGIYPKYNMIWYIYHIRRMP